MNRKRSILYFCIILLLLNLPPIFSQADSQAVRRFGIFIGSNYGGTGRATLLYASSDAERFAEVLHEMGGLEEEDSILLLEPNPVTVKNSFSQIQNRIRVAKKDSRRVEFLFYYSGHSNEQGILLGNASLPFVELRDRINSVGADVNIAVLDSCFSGTFTRLKGGTRTPPFLLDQSVETKGHAFLTSSSADEAAQESDALGASFFTHYFISGLRGAADSNRDGKITLHEAHAFAASETLMRTTSTQAGPQHPSYDINLSGSGDLVLTDLRVTSAQIMLDQEVEGRLFIRDKSNRLVTELKKNRGLPVSIALPPGEYHITLDSGNELFQTSINLHFGSRISLGMKNFSFAYRELARVRGDNPETPENYYINLDTSIAPILAFPESGNRVIVNNLALGLIVDVYRIQGVSIGLINTLGEDVLGVQLSPLFNTVGRNVNGFQASGVFNVVEGSVEGAQLAGVFNVVEGAVNFLQTAGVFNVTSGDTSGFQAAGVFNIAGGSLDGFQGAGVFNIGRGGKGFQGAGVFNITEGFFEGFQGAGVFNAAGDFKGFQGSVVNVAKDLRGVQLGVVNIGQDVEGTQLGLVNINRDITGLPIGLINISTAGLHNLSIFSDEKGFTYAGFQFGTKSFYTFIFGGVDSKAPETDLASGIGLGTHFTAGPLYLDIDFSAKHLVQAVTWEDKLKRFFNFGTQTFPSLRVSLGITLAKNLSLFGGIYFDGLITGITEPTRFHEGNPVFTFPLERFGTDISAYKRWFVGIRI